MYGYIYIHTIPTVLASLSTPTLPPGVKENQRYPFNRDERQTANMIKFATCPRVLHHLRSGATALSPNLRASSSPATTGGEVRP